MEKENASLNIGEVVSPQEINEMDDEAFDAYIQSAKNSDGEVQAAENPGTAEPARDADEVYMSFATKEDLQAYQDKTIGSRLREIREAGERDRERLADLSALAERRYKTQNGEEAIQLLMSELERGETSGSGMRSELEYRRRVENIQNEWLRQAEALKNIIPDFDIEKAFENPDFYKSVVEGKTLAEAYPALTKKPQRRAISEVGNLTNGVAGHITHDVRTMSDKEFDEYIKKIKNNEL